MNDSFQSFCLTYGKIVGELMATNILEKITESIYSGADLSGVCIDSVESLDQYGLNKIITGNITIGSSVYYFKIEDGNNNGTVVLDWVLDYNWIEYLKKKIECLNLIAV